MRGFRQAADVGVMHYISTRGGMLPHTFTDILLQGLAPDGGLVVPDDYSQIDAQTLRGWRELDYASLAFELLSGFAPDIAPGDLKRLTAAAYDRTVFGTAEVAPLEPLSDGLYLLQLSNGPTLAFKDIAMQLLGQLFEYVLEQRGDYLNILGATSGDTGSSAEYAMLGKARVRVFMLSPEDGMSPFQRAQMYSLEAPNIFNVAVRGVFDDCQDLVKAVSEDAEFKARHRVGAVNSINWARIAAQVVYYFKAWLALDPAPGERISFAVPTGNFGNVCAGHVARQMGLPIHRLIVATNENDVLNEFFHTGIYRPRPSAQVHRTSSPSMDISKASNFERFVFDLLERDADRLAALWQALARGQPMDLGSSGDTAGIERFGFASGSSTHADRLRVIRHAHAAWGRIVDPHTADGIKVALEEQQPGERVVCLETAQPAKFAATIQEALGAAPPRPHGLEDLERRAQHCDLLEPDLQTLKSYIESRVSG
jgi:threonine synthase